MSAKMPVNLIAARRWEMTDEKTGELRTGTTFYLDNDEEQTTNNPDYIGLRFLKLSAPLDVFKKLKLAKIELPAALDLVVNFKLGQDGKAVPNVLDIEI
jgi:hypothetical protein